MQTNKRGKVIASFSGSQSVERVTACVAREGRFDITTEHEGQRCTYLGVGGPIAVGAEVETPIACRLKQIHVRPWSPFDGEDDD